MCGRGADKERIVEILRSQSMGGNQFPMDVIAIIGLGGMGKTTLARLVYEDGRMKDQFQHRAWVCVSEEFDVDRVTREILRSLNCSIHESDKLHSCQLKLKETLMGKEFFLVLDDVWNENHKIWEVFQAPLKHVAPQSKILITTRNENVAKVMCCRSTHSLKPLEGEDCWNLFAKHAFDNQHHAANPDLKPIGEKIVSKCGGLPLAIKTLGSLLHKKCSFQYWDKILKSDIWELSENDSNIIPSLRLSYHYLPSKLKRCFAYCSIFPKDYNIDKNGLIQLWMADGLIYPTQKSMSLEEAGNEMFNDLESRSFFEPSREGDDYFIMHDLVNDLAKSVTQEFFVQLEVDQAQVMSTKTRYFSYTSKTSGDHKISEEVFKCHQLRTFLLLDAGTFSNYYLDVDIMSRLSRLKYIRELSLRRYKNGSKNWTDGISNLKHLHYLDLSKTDVEKLSNSMCLLINLQTLKLRGCKRLAKLPSNFYKLVNLRHLDLEDCAIKKMPKHMGKLNQLRTMNEFVVAKEGGSTIKELGALEHLTGSLTISNMEWIKDVADMREANLKEKQLHTLNLLYGQYNCSCKEAQHQEQVLEALKSNHNVKDLTIKHYGGYKFPKWLADVSHLVSLVLRCCDNITSLPPLGQLPFLQNLLIEGLNGIKVIGEEFYGNGSSIAPFPRLSYLEFDDMGKWEEWDICYEGESFPCLEELHISWCSRLKKSLPQHPPCLKTLHIEGCENLEALELNHNVKHLAVEGSGSNKFPKWLPDVSHFLPNLVSLVLDNCPNIESLPPLGQLPSLQKLTLKGLDGIKVIGEEFYGNGSSIAPFPRLSYLEFDNMGKWEEWDICYEGESFPNLVSLVLRGCPNIESLPPLGQLPSLLELTLKGLEGIKVIGEEFYGNGSSIAPFPRLSYLEFDNMGKWEEWDICYEGESFPNLASLILRGCPNIESLPPLGQLPSLQKLTIEGLRGIKVIGEEFYGNGSSIAPFPRLSYLEFYDMGEWEEWDICYEGESFPCLEELRIFDCLGLKKSLPQDLPCLKTLDIFKCENLEATLPKSSCMEKLSLTNCGKIRVKDMPTWSSSDVLPPLHDLTLHVCPAMESLPQGGMLSSLQRLSIRWCSSKLIESGRDWGLHELLSLKQLEIVGLKDMECFPEEGLLPPNLQSLSFWHCHNMKRINHRGLVHLHSLTSLSFIDCPSMSFEGMPEDGLPPSLSHLSIGRGCPLLEKRCEKEKGPDWPIIAHIPHIHM